MAHKFRRKETYSVARCMDCEFKLQPDTLTEAEKSAELHNQQTSHTVMSLEEIAQEIVTCGPYCSERDDHYLETKGG